MTKIHILGFGSIGGLIGVHLSKVPGISVIPILRSRSRVAEFESINSVATVVRLFDNTEITSTLSAVCPETLADPIDNLVVTTKTYQTVDALQPILDKIGPKTNIIMVQNGMGVAEMLYKLWPKLEERPNLYQGVISHGVFSTTPFVFTHAGWTDMKISKLTSISDESVETESVLLNALLECKLDTSNLPYKDLLTFQLEKLFVNCCMNSVTAIVDCVNGELASLPETKPVFRSIVSEGIEVFKKEYSALFEDEKIVELLSADRLVDFIVHVGCILNKHNSTSMRQDTLNLRDTEIDYINGYVVEVGRKHNLNVSTNATIVQLVKLRLQLNRSRK